MITHQMSDQCPRCGSSLNLRSKTHHKCRLSTKTWEKISTPFVPLILTAIETKRQQERRVALTKPQITELIKEVVGPGIFRTNAGGHVWAVTTCCQDNDVPTWKRDQKQFILDHPINEMVILRQAINQNNPRIIFKQLGVKYRDACARSFLIYGTSKHREETSKVPSSRGHCNRDINFSQTARTYPEVQAIRAQKDNAKKKKRRRKQRIPNIFVRNGDPLEQSAAVNHDGDETQHEHGERMSSTLFQVNKAQSTVNCCTTQHEHDVDVLSEGNGAFVVAANLQTEEERLHHFKQRLAKERQQHDDGNIVLDLSVYDDCAVVSDRPINADTVISDIQTVEEQHAVNCVEADTRSSNVQTVEEQHAVNCVDADTIASNVQTDELNAVNRAIATTQQELESRAERLRRFKQRLELDGLDIQAEDEDGNCFYRSISSQLFGSPVYHQEMRQLSLKYMLVEKDRYALIIGKDSEYLGETVEEHCKRMSRDGVFADSEEIHAIVQVFQRPIHIFEDIPQRSWPQKFDMEKQQIFGDPILLARQNDNHYQSLVRLDGSKSIWNNPQDIIDWKIEQLNGKLERRQHGQRKKRRLS